MLLNLEVSLDVNDLEETNFNALLNLRPEVVPKIGVSGWGKLGKAKSELGGCEVSCFDGIGSWIRWGGPLRMSRYAEMSSLGF